MSLILSLAMFILLLGLLLFGSPVAYTIGIIGTLWMHLGQLPIPIIPQRLFNGMSQFTLMAVPFFILAGNLMNSSGIARELVSFVNFFLGRFRGGLAQANIGTSLIFAGITGAAISDVAALGSIFIPEMERNGYSRSFSSAVTAASSIVGPIIPPSIIIVLYSSVTGVSVGTMFMAAILPGVAIGLTQMILTYFIARKRNYPRYEMEKMSFKAFMVVLSRAILALIMPVIIIGGVVSGMFTPTESAAIAVLYALVVGKFVFKKITMKVFLDDVKDTVRTTGMLLFIIAVASVLSWILSYINLPVILANGLIGILGNRWLVFFAVVLMLIFVGTWMESGAALIMLAPVFSQVLGELGFNPIHYGVVIIITLNLGLITPPLGVCLFAVAGVAHERFEKIARDIVPYLVVIILTIILIVILPDITLSLPKLLGMIG